jgi:hypothetical protein
MWSYLIDSIGSVNGNILQVNFTIKKDGKNINTATISVRASEELTLASASTLTDSIKVRIAENVKMYANFDNSFVKIKTELDTLIGREFEI